jgi:hypothetical protein
MCAPMRYTLILSRIPRTVALVVAHGSGPCLWVPTRWRGRARYLVPFCARIRGREASPTRRGNRHNKRLPIFQALCRRPRCCRWHASGHIRPYGCLGRRRIGGDGETSSRNACCGSETGDNGSREDRFSVRHGFHLVEIFFAGMGTRSSLRLLVRAASSEVQAAPADGPRFALSVMAVTSALRLRGRLGCAPPALIDGRARGDAALPRIPDNRELVRN